MTVKAQKPSTLLWFRQDLRLADNPALQAAIGRGTPVIPVFIWAPDEEGAWPPGAASKWWLHQSLAALAGDLHRLGARLILRQGPTLETLRRLLTQTGANAVFWNRRYEPAIYQRDTRFQEALRAGGIQAESFNAALLHEPWTIQNKSGKPFQVFTPFWKHCLSLSEPRTPLPPPAQLPSPRKWPDSLDLAALKLEPVPDWAGGLRTTWQPGVAGATAQLDRFLATAFAA
ncbi:MAG TPA: deoxyribodipyrimidine photo-lyase, partial [Candidatus Sulfotelmatobacter sp.]|nr:deoxyribodipyrimidine photo-lyase [Candidatus Sulfotelmatobacter sp.]